MACCSKSSGRWFRPLATAICIAVFRMRPADDKKRIQLCGFLTELPYLWQVLQLDLKTFRITPPLLRGLLELQPQALQLLFHLIVEIEILLGWPQGVEVVAFLESLSGGAVLFTTLSSNLARMAFTIALAFSIQPGSRTGHITRRT